MMRHMTLSLPVLLRSQSLARSSPGDLDLPIALRGENESNKPDRTRTGSVALVHQTCGKCS
eukprot:4689714-Pyramimonas_sp.AAC.1